MKGAGERERRKREAKRKESDAGCVRVVPCGIGRSQGRHAFLLRMLSSPGFLDF